jgi:hypothetical protein
MLGVRSIDFYFFSPGISSLLALWREFLPFPIVVGSVTAKIGLYKESDLSMYFQEILQTNLLGLFGVAGNT